MKNILYYFLKNEINFLKEESFFQPKNFKFKNPNDKTSYTLYDLPFLDLTLEDDDHGVYVLTSHHVSFYEMESLENPALSQYHYTCYFTKDGKEYELHAFFNRNDQLATNVIFSIKKDDGLYHKQKISEELSEELTTLAINQCFNFISAFRKQFLEKFLSLTKSYETTEAELANLSKNLEVNYDEYQKKSREIVATLEQLANYSYDSQYDALYQLFLNYKIAFHPTGQSPETITQEATENSTQESKPAISVTNLSTNNNEQDNKIAIDIQKAEQTRDKYLALTKDSTKERIDAFLAFDTAISDLTAASLTSQHSFTHDWQKFQSLTSQCLLEGKKLLLYLLFSKQIELANLLKKFAGLISENIITMMIKNGNALALDFLLTNCTFAINTSLIDGLPPVHYCLFRDTETKPNIDCFSILIKHKASLMLKLSNGLPFAHHMFSTHHAFIKALYKYPDHYVGNPHFYKQLIKQTTAYMKNKDMKQSTKTKLLVDIDTYRSHLNKISQTSWARNSSIISNNWQKVDEVIQRHDLSGYSSLKSDPEIQASFAAYCDAANELRDCEKSERENRKKAIVSDLETETIDQILKSFDPKSSHFKQDVIAKIDEYTTMIKISIEFKTLHPQLSTGNIKNQKEARKRMNHLMEQFKKLMGDSLKYSNPEERAIAFMTKNSHHLMTNKTEIKFGFDSKSKTDAELVSTKGFISNSSTKEDDKQSFSTYELPKNNSIHHQK